MSLQVLFLGELFIIIVIKKNYPSQRNDLLNLSSHTGFIYIEPSFVERLLFSKKY